MIENKSLGSKIFDILNVVILIAVALICIVPVWYVLCVSLSSREAVNAGQVALWPVGFNLLSYKKIMGETAFFGSFLVSIKRVLLGTGISMVCILMAAFPLSRTKKQFPKRDAFFDETLWIPQHPDSPEYGEETCKLCGGVGDLRKLKYKWDDTRNING